MSQETRPECANHALPQVTFHVFWLARFRHAEVTFHPAVPGRVHEPGMPERASGRADCLIIAEHGMGGLDCIGWGLD